MKKTICLWILSLIFCNNLIAQKSSGKEKLAAFIKHEELIKKSYLKSLEWRLVGPDNKSGRSTEVIGITNNKNILYAAFATGGFWKSEDAGSNWNSLFDKQATQSIGSIAIAPSDNNTLYVGTGEANILRASLPGVGIYKTNNAGKSFQHVGLESTGTISRIVVHPKNKNHVYVAASGNEWTYNKDRGVYITKDGGKTWKNILFIDDKTGCIDLVMDPSNPNILYASMWNRIRKRWSDPTPEDGDYIYKTFDGGKNWKKIYDGLPDTKLTGRIGLAIAASNPKILYAYVDDHNIKREPKENEKDAYERVVQKVVIGGAIYRSEDEGEHWTKQSEIHDFVTPFSGTYGWVFSQIRVNPKNENEVYAMGVMNAKSEDAGKTWKKFISTDSTSDGIHGDNHAMWFDEEDPNIIFLGNDGGVSITYDGGKKWKNFFNKIPTTQFYTVAYDMEKPFNIFGSIQDEGTFSGNSNNTFGKTQDSTLRAWDYAPGGEGTQIQVDPKNSNIVFSSSFYGRLMKSDLSKPKKDRSKKIALFDVGRIDSLRGEWLAGTLMSKFNSKVIYHGLQHLYKSDDAGETWKKISDDLSNNNPEKKGKYPYLIYHQTITTIAEDVKPGVLYVGTDDGNIWYTESDGKTWEKISNGLPQHKHIIKIVSTKYSQGTIYVALNDRREDNQTAYLYKTNNYGKTWESISSNLPASPVNVVIVDEKNNKTLYCGTDMGVYMSKNKGKSWACINANLPTAISVNDMFMHPRDHKLVIGTYGRGVYLLDDISKLD